VHSVDSNKSISEQALEMMMSWKRWN